jgi:hypothetical protein
LASNNNASLRLLPNNNRVIKLTATQVQDVNLQAILQVFQPQGLFSGILQITIHTA